MEKIDYLKKKKLIDLAGACFYFYETSFYPFLEGCGVSGKVLKKYPREAYKTKYAIMENILNELEHTNQEDVIKKIISTFYRMNKAGDDDYFKKHSPDNSKKAINLLMEFRELVGNDPIEEAIKERRSEDNKIRYQNQINETKYKKDKLNDIKNKFLSLIDDKVNSPQKRGFELEKIFYDLLNHEGFECNPSYKNNNEQMDAFFYYEKFPYLVEIKWQKEVAKKEVFSIFDGKIRGKAQSTRGLLISVNGFCLEAIKDYSKAEPRIVLMDGADIMMILENRVSLSDYLRSKIDALSMKGEIFHKIKF